MEVPPPLSLMFSPHRVWDTEVFLSLLVDQAMHSTNPFIILDGYRITSMVIRKISHAPQHEFIVFRVSDTSNFILERTVSTSSEPDNDTVYEFLNHPESSRLLNIIMGSLTPSAAASAALVAAPIAAASLIIPFTGISSGPPLPLMDEGPIVPSSHLPLTITASVAPKYSIFDQTSITLAELLHKVSNTDIGNYVSQSLKLSKPPKDSRAHDNFLGEDKLTSDYYSLKFGTDLGEFRPKNLTLFHLALLAHVVHVQYPLYALFMNQCYWFSNTVFSAAQIIDRDLSFETIPCPTDGPPTIDEECDQIYLPFHLYIPSEAGRWKGIKISGCKTVILDTIIRKFHEQLRESIAKVFSHCFRIIYCVLNS
jgi:hypothetical protein